MAAQLDNAPGLPAAPVLVVGAGLIGASVAMALSRAGVETYVRDLDPTVAHVAASRGAGSDRRPPRDPALVVVATPPDQLAEQVEAALSAYPSAVVTDVGSVKSPPLAALELAGVEVRRYVGGHPLAGSERSGPMAASADLFDGRTWAVVPHTGADADAVQAVVRLAETCGAVAVTMSAEQHDAAVARTSHLPHVVAAVTAARLTHAPREHLALSGQGVRDVTRIAAGDPTLWRQIVRANAGALAPLLVQVRDDIDELLRSLASGNDDRVEEMLRSGATGAAVIPAKHGGSDVHVETLSVAIPDEPGALAALFGHAGDAGVNIEDLRIDHDPARAYGQVEIDVAAGQADVMVEALRAQGWSAHR
ncbi:MAG: prephenate dehydrogenase [Nocardioidaceae bacterium]